MFKTISEAYEVLSDGKIYNFYILFLIWYEKKKILHGILENVFKKTAHTMTSSANYFSYDNVK